MNSPNFDLAAAHRYFAAHCFNTTWDYLDKSQRTPAEESQMIATVQASLYHWSQRSDATQRNWSIGYWQVSRVYAVIGNADEALRYGAMSLEQADDSFCRGYALEAMARAESLKGNNSERDALLLEAQKCLTQIISEEDRTALAKDLATIH